MDIKGIDKSKIKENLKPVMPVISALLYGAVGFMLARGLIFAEYAPFGIAYCATATPLGVIGAILGYISMLHKANGLKYVAICILIYTADYIFRGTELSKNRLFMPFATFICTASIGFVFVVEDSFAVKTLAFYIAEVLLATVCSYFYKQVGSSGSKKIRKLSLAILVTTLIIPLTGIDFLSLSLGRIIAGVLIMCVGFYGGVGVGCATGVALSVAMGAGATEQVAIYGICGLVAPLFKSRGEYFYAIAYLAGAATAMLWVKMEVSVPFLYETLVSSGVFVIAIRFFGDRLQEAFRIEGGRKGEDYKLKKYLEERISRTADAFWELAGLFTVGRDKQSVNFATVFDAPAHKVCKKCVLASTCWEREYITTKGALESAVKAMSERGELCDKDFPVHFSARCIKLDEFLREANYELSKVLYRVKFSNRINESRGILKKQYDQMSKVLNQLKGEINLSFDAKFEAKIADFFAREEISAYPTVYRDSANHVHIEIRGERLSRLCCEEFSKDLGQVLGFGVTEPYFTTDDEGEIITMRQKEILCAMMGAALNKKKGAEISGDAGSYFRTEEGCLAVILADGMGSGKEAACVSSAAIKMIERFVKAGIDMGLALGTINSALTLSGEESGAFSTVDFMKLNLYNGKAVLYKMGSAPTYIKRAKSVRAIRGTSLPAGVPVPSGNQIEQFNLQICVNDFIVFLTDGALDAGDDQWLVDLIANYEGESARELSNEIIAAAVVKYGRSDDMTVLVVRVDKNK